MANSFQGMLTVQDDLSLIYFINLTVQAYSSFYFKKKTFDIIKAELETKLTSIVLFQLENHCFKGET